MSYYVRHMTETKLQMQHHGVGVMGARAMAIALVVSCCWLLNLRSILWQKLVHFFASFSLQCNNFDKNGGGGGGGD